ncbi:MAG: DUF3343 domain-containing protein [Synergistaceae bacterium]|nr:DUF3343 domain-containing protein [Synergistaceae bacterium]
MIYIATFFSHFGATRFKRYCDSLGIPAQTMPVPRGLSSSCGTCTKFETQQLPDYGKHTDELEKIAAVTDNGFETVYESEV